MLRSDQMALKPLGRSCFIGAFDLGALFQPPVAARLQPFLSPRMACAGVLASQQTILWSRPAGAAVGTPNPGKAGHIAVTNATHFVAAAGMGALGSEDMPSETADVLDLREPDAGACHSSSGTRPVVSPVA